MTIKKTLTDIVFVGTLALSGPGCSNKFIPEYLEGKVTKESGSVVNLMESSGALFGNESVKFGNPSYVLKVETCQGRYVISVDEIHSRVYKPLVALAEAIEVGDKIRFKTNYKDGPHVRDNFSKDRIGSIYSNDIELLGK